MSKTKKEYEDIIAQIRVGAANIAIDFGVPVRSGDLKNSFQINKVGKSIEIGTNIYYMPYTNESWLSPKWKGRDNPNEGWFEESTEFMVQMIARHLGGKYVKVK